MQNKKQVSKQASNQPTKPMGTDNRIVVTREEGDWMKTKKVKGVQYMVSERY